jgi:TonB family protein
MIRYSPLVLVLLCFCCVIKDNQPSGSKPTNDSSVVTLKQPTVDIYLQSSPPTRRASEIRRDIEKPKIQNPSLYDSLRALNDHQVFEAAISNDRDTILSLPQGTRLLIPSNAFGTRRGNPRLVNLKVREYYSLADIVSENLTTTTKDNILETGGMIHIVASGDGEECSLNSGKEIQISFPVNVWKPGMQLFRGTRDSLKRIEWEVPPSEQTTLEVSNLNFVVEQMPEFPGGYEALTRYLRKNLSYPADARRKGIEGIVFVTFVVDDSGSVVNPAVVGGVHRSLDKAAIDVISTMPKWVPGRNGKKPVDVTMTFPIRFSLDGTNLSVSPNAVNPYSDQQIKNFGKNMTDSKIADSAMDEVSYYILRTANLGWINCDRFIDAKVRIDFRLFIPEADSGALDVKLIFKNIRAILPGVRVGDYYHFPNVPQDEQADILALRTHHRRLEMANKSIKLGGKDPDPVLSFQPITVTKLKDYLLSFEKKSNDNALNSLRQ